MQWTRHCKKGKIITSCITFSSDRGKSLFSRDICIFSLFELRPITTPETKSQLKIPKKKDNNASPGICDNLAYEGNLSKPIDRSVIQ